MTGVFLFGPSMASINNNVNVSDDYDDDGDSLWRLVKNSVYDLLVSSINHYTGLHLSWDRATIGLKQLLLTQIIIECLTFGITPSFPQLPSRNAGDKISLIGSVRRHRELSPRFPQRYQ